VTALVTVVGERLSECQEQRRREQRACEQEREDAGPAAWRIRDDPVVLQNALGFATKIVVHSRPSGLRVQRVPVFVVSRVLVLSQWEVLKDPLSNRGQSREIRGVERLF